MKLVVERDALASALGRLSGVVDTKQIIAILGNLLLTARDRMLTIRASNLDMEAMESIPAAIETPGEITAPANKLNEIARGLAAGSQIKMNLDNGRLGVTSGRSRFALGTLPVTSFPALWTDEFPGQFEIMADAFAAMLDSVSFAQGPEATRAQLMGVRFDIVEGRLRLVATNGVALALRDGPEVPPFDAATVPAKMIAEMARILGQADSAVKFGIAGDKVMMASGEVVITSKLIDRSLGYPNYMRVVPVGLPHSGRVDVEDATRAIRRAQLASQYAKGRTVRLTFAPGRLLVSSKNSEAEAVDETDFLYDGPEVGVSLDPSITLELLSHLNGAVAEVQFEDKDKPLVWRVVDDPDGYSIIMPQVF